MKKINSLLVFILFILCSSCMMTPPENHYGDDDSIETENEDYLIGVDSIGSLCVENLTGKDLVIVRFNLSKKSYVVGTELIYDSMLCKEVKGIKAEDSTTLRLPAGKGSLSFFFSESGKKQTLIEKIEIKSDETTTIQITKDSKVRVEY